MANTTELVKILLEFDTQVTSENNAAEYIKRLQAALKSLEDQGNTTAKVLTSTVGDFGKAFSDAGSAIEVFAQKADIKSVIEVIIADIKDLEIQLRALNGLQVNSEALEKFATNTKAIFEGIRKNASGTDVSKFLDTLRTSIQEFTAGSINPETFVAGILNSSALKKEVRSQVDRLIEDVKKALSSGTTPANQAAVVKQILTAVGLSENLGSDVVKVLKPTTTEVYENFRTVFAKLTESLKESITQGATQDQLNIGKLIAEILAKSAGSGDAAFQKTFSVLFDEIKSTFGKDTVEVKNFIRDQLGSILEGADAKLNTAYDKIINTVDRDTAKLFSAFSKFSTDLNVDTFNKKIIELQSSLSKPIPQALIESLGEPFQDAFKKATENFDLFKNATGKSLNVAAVNSFSDSVKNLIAQLEVLAKNDPFASIFLKLLTDYEKVATQVRLDTIFEIQAKKAQESLKSLANSIESIQFNQKDFTIATKDPNVKAAEELSKAKSEALVAYQNAYANLQEQINSVEASLTKFLETTDKANKNYSLSEKALNAVEVKVNAFQTTITALKEAQDVATKKFQEWNTKTLDSVNATGNATVAFDRLEAVMSGVGKTTATSGLLSWIANILELRNEASATGTSIEDLSKKFQQLGNTNEQAANNVRTVADAFKNLFVGKQVDGVLAAPVFNLDELKETGELARIVRERILALGAASKEASSRVGQLTLINDFFKQIGQSDTSLGQQIQQLHTLTIAAQQYQNTLIELQEKESAFAKSSNDLQTNLNRVKRAFEELKNQNLTAAERVEKQNELNNSYRATETVLKSLTNRYYQINALKASIAESQNIFGTDTSQAAKVATLAASIKTTDERVQNLRKSWVQLNEVQENKTLLENVKKVFEGASKTVDDALNSLKQRIEGRLNTLFSSLNITSVQSTLSSTISNSFADSLKAQLDSITSNLKSGNLNEALTTIRELISGVSETFKANLPKDATKQQIEEYIKPWSTLSGKLEIELKAAQDVLASQVPRLSQNFPGSEAAAKINGTFEAVTKGAAGAASELVSFNNTLKDSFKASGFALLRSEIDSIIFAIKDARTTPITIEGITSLQERLQQIRKDLKDYKSEFAGAFDTKAISALGIDIFNADKAFKELNKNNTSVLTTELTNLESKFKGILVDTRLTGDALKSLFQQQFSGDKLIPFDSKKIDAIGTAIRESLNKAADTSKEQESLKQLEDRWKLLKDAALQYNVVVSLGGAGNLGAQALADSSSISTLSLKVKDLTIDLTNAKDSLKNLVNQPLSSSGIEQTITSFTQLQNKVNDLGSDVGKLSNVSTAIDKILNSLKSAGVTDQNSLYVLFKDIQDQIKNTRKEHESLQKQFANGFIKQGLESDLNKLRNAQELIAQVTAIKANTTASNIQVIDSRGAQQAYQEIQRLETALRSLQTQLTSSLNISRGGVVDPSIRKKLEDQKTAVADSIVSLQNLGKVYDNLQSKSKIEIFNQLKTTLDSFGKSTAAESILALKNSFADLQIGATYSINSIKSSSVALTNDLVNNFKDQASAIEKNIVNYEQWLHTLRALQDAGKTKFFSESGQEFNISALITQVKDLNEEVRKLKTPIAEAGETLKEKLGTSGGQAELKISTLIEKFGVLKERIDGVSSGQPFNALYGNIRELLALLNKPLENGPFYTLPKDSYAPIRNELQGVRQEAASTAHALAYLITAAERSGTQSHLIAGWRDELVNVNKLLMDVEKGIFHLKEAESRASNFAELRSNLHGASTTLNELAHEGAFLYKGLERLFASIGRNLTINPKVNTASIEGGINKIKTQFNITEEAAKNLQVSIQRALQPHLDSAGIREAEKYAGAFKQLEQAFVKFRSGMTQAAMGFQMLGDSLLDPFKKAKENFEQFSDTMGVVNAVTNATESQFEALTQKAILMGATTRFTAEQAAEGLVQLAKAGFTAEQQLAALPTVMRLAQAAATELATAATIATVVMNEFQMDPTQFNAAADVITLAANRTLASVEDLGFSFKYVGALAANIGADFGELTGSIAALHNAGLKGTLSGTALRGILQALYNPTADETRLIKDLSERIGGMGLTIQDSSGKFVGFTKIVRQLEQAGITTGEVLRLFGQRAGPGMAALLAQGSEKLQQLDHDLKNAEGTTAHMAQIMEETLKGKLLLMRSAFQALADSIGHTLAPTLMYAADALANFISKIVAIREEFPTLALVVDHVLAGFALLASTLGGLAVTFAFILVPVRQFLGFLRTLVVTTLAGAAAAGSSALALAGNTAAIAATTAAVEGLIAAHVAEAASYGVTLTALQIDAYARRIDTAAILEQQVALKSATASAGAAAAAQAGTLSLWTGFKNILKNIAATLFNIGKLTRFLLSPWGLLITAAATFAGWVLLHKKSVSQTNVELEKQTEIVEFTRKQVEGLNQSLQQTTGRLKQNQKILEDLLKGGESEAVTNLQVKIEEDKASVQKQLQELYTRISEDLAKKNSTFKGKLGLDINFDSKGNFETFKVSVAETGDVLNLVQDGVVGTSADFAKLNTTLNSFAQSQQRVNTELRLSNVLFKELGVTLAKGKESTFSNILNFITANSLSESRGGLNELEDLTTQANIKLDALNKIKAKFLETGKVNRVDTKFLDAADALQVLNGVAGESKIQTLNRLTSELSQKRSNLTSQVDKTINDIVEKLNGELPKILNLSSTSIAGASNRANLIDSFLNRSLSGATISQETKQAIRDRVQKYWENLGKTVDAQSVAGDSLRAPVQLLASVAQEAGNYVDNLNKELKKRLDEQEKIINEYSAFVKEIEAYQKLVEDKLKQHFELDNQDVEFKAKISLDVSDNELKNAQQSLKQKSAQFGLDFKVDITTSNQYAVSDLAKFAAEVKSLEKKSADELLKLQITSVTEQNNIKKDSLESQRTLIEEHYSELEKLYLTDEVNYTKVQQEKQKGLAKVYQDELALAKDSESKLYELKNQALDRAKVIASDNIDFQTKASQTLQKIQEATQSDSEKEFFQRQNRLRLQSEAEKAIQKGDYEYAKQLLEEKQQLIADAAGKLAPKDTVGQFFLKQDQEEASAAYKKATDALSEQNKSVVADLNSQIVLVKVKIKQLEDQVNDANESLKKLATTLFAVSKGKLAIDVDDSSYINFEKLLTFIRDGIRKVTKSKIGFDYETKAAKNRLTNAAQETEELNKEKRAVYEVQQSFEEVNAALAKNRGFAAASNQISDVENRAGLLIQKLIELTDTKVISPEQKNNAIQQFEDIKQSISGVRSSLNKIELSPELDKQLKQFEQQWLDLLNQPKNFDNEQDRASFKASLEGFLGLIQPFTQRLITEANTAAAAVSEQTLLTIGAGILKLQELAKSGASIDVSTKDSSLLEFARNYLNVIKELQKLGNVAIFKDGQVTNAQSLAKLASKIQAIFQSGLSDEEKSKQLRKLQPEILQAIQDQEKSLTGSVKERNVALTENKKQQDEVLAKQKEQQKVIQETPKDVKITPEVEDKEDSVGTLVTTLKTLVESPKTISVFADVQNAFTELQNLAGYLAEIKDKTITVTINTVRTESGDVALGGANSGGLIPAIQKFANGGLSKFKKLPSPIVPGSGNQDTIPAMLTPGEYVFDKDTVKRLGVGFLRALHKGAVQFKALGGAVFNAPTTALNSLSGYTKPQLSLPAIALAGQSSGGGTVDIRLTLGDKSFNIKKTPRESANVLVSALQYLERGTKR